MCTQNPAKSQSLIGYFWTVIKQEREYDQLMVQILTIENNIYFLATENNMLKKQSVSQHSPSKRSKISYKI